jgi:type III pantothenate kinase
MILLFDIGNTHTHLGLANERRVVRQGNIPTGAWFDQTAPGLIRRFIQNSRIEGAALCSVVPRATPRAARTTRGLWRIRPLALTPATIAGVGINYPRPATIGPDRLANAVAVRTRYGSPAVVVDFGTAVTFDVVDRNGDYVGGIIAPGLAAMTDYLHEKTALLPKIAIR